MNPAGHILVLEVASKKEWLGNSSEKKKIVVEYGVAQAAAEGHIWVPHREGDGGLDVRLIQQRSFFMFTFMIFSNTFNIIWTNIPSRDMWLQPVRIP